MHGMTLQAMNIKLNDKGMLDTFIHNYVGWKGRIKLEWNWTAVRERLDGLEGGVQDL